MVSAVLATIIFLVELVLVFLAILCSLLLEKRCLCAPRALFLGQQMLLFVYILFYLNPFYFSKETDEQLAYDLVSFELLSSSFIVLIYLGMLHTSAARSAISFLALTFLLIAAFACFVSVSVCEWTIKDPLLLSGTKLFSYQATQVVLFVLITMCVIRLTIRQDTEKSYKLQAFVPYHIVTLFLVITLTIVPKFVFFLAVLLGNSSQETLSILKSLLFITPFHNLVFVVLVNAHDPQSRDNMIKSVELSLRSIRTGPLPRINVQEPTSSSALPRVTHTPRRSHIALNLMRNPLNSFNKLQRQNTLNAEENREPHLLVIPKQHYYTTSSNERIEVGPIQEPHEILTSRSATEPGYRTIALLRRASMISMRIQGDLSSDSEPQTLRSSAESLVDQVSVATSPSREPSPPPVTSSSDPEERRADVFSIFVTSTSSVSAAPTPMERKKRAVDRVREILGFR